MSNIFDDFKSQRMIQAADIARSPDAADAIRGRYQIVFDTTLNFVLFDNMDRAIKIMGEKGWRPTAMSVGLDVKVGRSIMYVLLEKTQ